MRATCPICGAKGGNCGDAVLALPPVDFNAPPRDAPRKVIRVRRGAAGYNKARRGPTEDKAVKEPPEDK